MGKGIIAGGAGGSSEELIHQLISVHNADAEAHESIRNSISAVGSTAQNALSTAQEAVQAASNAQGTANSAQSAANAAQSTANGAASAASTAQSTANSAATAASNAMTVAQNAQTAAASKAPMYTYGTDDLTAGTSPLASGQLHFVYE